MKRHITMAIGMALLLCVGASSAWSAPTSGDAGVRAFAERVVRSLNDTSNKPTDWEHLSRRGGYDPSLIRLMDENNRLAQGVDLLDSDPLCQCQDTGGHYVLSALSQTDPDDATASIAQAGQPVTAVLKRTGGAWHVYDVIDASGSLRARLIHHNKCMRTYKTDAAQVKCFGDS